MTSSAIFQTIIGNVYECHLQQFSSLDFIRTLQTPSAIFQTISCDILKTFSVTLSAIFQTIICNVYECHLQHFSLPDFILTLQTPFAILQTITCDILKTSAISQTMVCNVYKRCVQHYISRFVRKLSWSKSVSIEPGEKLGNGIPSWEGGWTSGRHSP